ncbi:MAG: SPOCS domain-containing protein [Clostridium sp.]
MSAVMRNLIQYEGIEGCNYINGNFKQDNIENTFCIPLVKPDIEQIVKVWGKAKINKYKIIKTPIGKSLEGQVLTGYKVLVMGEVKMKYEYVALEKEQSVHTAHNIVPFCSYVVMPEDFNPVATAFPTVLMEDIDSQQLNNRCIYSNITLMFNVEVC